MKKTHLHVLLVVAVVLFALNMRAGVTSIAPVLQEIQGGLHMSDSLAGFLTSLPTLIFALVGLITPLASRTLGLHTTMLVAMVALSLGLIVRVFMGGSAGFLVFSIVALAGIAITNVLMPAFIKTHFPAQIPTYTAVYSTALTAMAFLSSVVVAPMSHSMSTGWRGALGFWGCWPCWRLSRPESSSSCRRNTILRWVMVLRLAPKRALPLTRTQTA